MGLLRKVALGFLVIGGTLVAARPSEAQFIGSSSGSNSRHAAPFSLGLGPGFGFGYGNGFGNAYGYGYGNAYGYNPYVNSGYGYTRYYVNPAMTYNNLNGVGGIIGQSTRTPGTTFRRRR